MLFFKTLMTFLLLCLPAMAQTDTPAPLIKIIRTGPPVFHRPIACTPDKDCWILNYLDIGPENDGKATDSACLARTYEGHKGTDIAVRDEVAMKKGVDVLAAADGTVKRVRDSEPDRWATPADIEQVKKDRKECGNAVLIDHGNGWQTMYCHMKQGSIAVKPDQPVKTGDKIGEVGLSGMTEFPHLHFGVIHEDKVIDPFNGQDIHEPCGTSGKPLWDKDAGFSYEPLVFFAQGFDLDKPDLDTINRMRIDRSQLSKDIPALVFHSVLLGSRVGDKIDLQIFGPDGKPFAQSHTVQDKTRAQQMYFVGRKTPDGSTLEAGLYTGKIKVMRPEKDGKDQIYATELSIPVK